jgi:hypothetical protein
MLLRHDINSVVLRQPLLSPAVPAREAEDASLADLIRMVAESVADAQTALDRASAGLVAELAQTRVPIIPSIREIISETGDVTFEQADSVQVSLLDIGVMPTFYQFSQTVIEIAMDLKLTESLNESGKRSGNFALKADTAGIRFERKLNRDVKVSSKVTATLVPVPMPLRLEPVRATQASEPS